ncbi:MAG: Transcription elongation factor GreA [Alphaproteobacteria bacterium MarineAlpha6_Bin4]|nr:MAG: Transcription elongation factor GreA [Alphaproteobacteria bacterium MarineAlpha6_Bin3]PPR37046.1 MAG: Transcription elongation factor GreA [Alphaproteobacteria bacterium MarineAlpha6_Bin4]|tara:strand:- start:4770 stop:5237 length:468 start_codon:yes stop_codon:yes gene_type:complete
MNKIPLTKEGEKKLQDELRKLKQERPKISKAIAEAREHGDLKENAEYHAAREHQGIVEAKIKDIEFKLGNSEIIENENNDSKSQIIFGSIVELLNTEDNTKIKYQLVGEDEADLTKNKISFNSPIAKGLLNKKIGDTITISVPKGELNFKVISIN